NMKRDFKGFTREDIPLFPTMLVQSLVVQGEGSTHPVESHHTPISAPSTSQPLISSTSRRTTRQESVVPQPRSPTQTHVADEAASIGLDVRYGGATTTITSLEARQSSGNIDKTPTMPNDSPPPRVNTLRSDEGIMSLQELMVLCTTLSKKVESLETDLKQTKQIYGVAYTKLIKKDMEFETDFDAAKEVSTAEDVSIAKPVSIVGAVVTTASVITTSPTKVSTADDITLAETFMYIRRSAAKDKGKGKMDEFEPVQTKTKLQQEHERLGYEAAVRLQDELEEEERQRIASVHESASSFNIEEWEDIQARIQADEEFVQRAKERRNKPLTQAQQRTYMTNYIKHIGSHTLQQLRGYSFDELKALFETTVRRVSTFVPIESEDDKVVPELAVGSSKRDAEEELVQETSKRQKTGESLELAEEPRNKEDDEVSQEELQKMMIIVLEQGINVEPLQTKYPIIDWEIYTEGTRKTNKKRLFEPDIDDELWKLQKHIHDLTWKLYDSCTVHHVSTKKGIDIYMLVEKEYPLSRGTLTLRLGAKLLVEQDNEMSRELLRKIFLQAEIPRK
ncbi:hypothetical protein Tco_1305048, partial [Tanacetum coccineum]